MLNNLKRGDIVVVSVFGDYGKPRPAVVIQNSILNETHDSVVLCLITSHLTSSPLFRIRIQLSISNKLQKESEIMVDKIVIVRKHKIKEKIGKLNRSEITQINRGISFVLGLG